jgi:hypothetical protein
MAFDPLSKQMILFGGAIEGGEIPYSGTWRWNGTTWAHLYPKTVPPARGAEMTSFDPATHQLVMFGGFSARVRFLGNAWEWES